MVVLALFAAQASHRFSTFVTRRRTVVVRRWVMDTAYPTCGYTASGVQSAMNTNPTLPALSPSTSAEELWFLLSEEAGHISQLEAQLQNAIDFIMAIKPRPEIVSSHFHAITCENLRRHANKRPPMTSAEEKAFILHHRGEPLRKKTVTPTIRG